MDVNYQEMFDAKIIKYIDSCDASLRSTVDILDNGFFNTDQTNGTVLMFSRYNLKFRTLSLTEKNSIYDKLNFEVYGSFEEYKMVRILIILSFSLCSISDQKNDIYDGTILNAEHRSNVLKEYSYLTLERLFIYYLIFLAKNKELLALQEDVF